MLDPTTIAVSGVARSSVFYEKALEPFGITRLTAYGGTNDDLDPFGPHSDRAFRADHPLRNHPISDAANRHSHSIVPGGLLV